MIKMSSNLIELVTRAVDLVGKMATIWMIVDTRVESELVGSYAIQQSGKVRVFIIARFLFHISRKNLIFSI